jgi:hypothetical protein
VLEESQDVIKAQMQSRRQWLSWSNFVPFPLRCFYVPGKTKNTPRQPLPA